MAITRASPVTVIDVRPLGDKFEDTKTQTLIKSDTLEVIRLVLPAGKTIAEHRDPSEITLQVLEGNVQFTCHGRSHELTTGDLLFLDSRVPHTVSASDNSTVLLTMLMAKRSEDVPKLESADLSLCSSIGEWVAQHPQTADVFVTFRIDYCSDGNKSLEQACWDSGLEVLRVQSLLRRAVSSIVDTTVENWLHRPLAELCDHIEETHHAFLKQTLPSLSSLIAKVVELQGDQYKDLQRAQSNFIDWRDDILGVMSDEERSLFPSIRQLERQEHPVDHDIASIAAMIRPIRFLHQDIAKAIRMVQDVSADSRIPKDDCPEFFQMHELLRQVEADVRKHIHKEEYILFPRVLDFEASGSQLQINHPCISG